MASAARIQTLGGGASPQNGRLLLAVADAGGSLAVWAVA
jgi:hypothetical protein